MTNETKVQCETYYIWLTLMTTDVDFKDALAVPVFMGCFDSFFE